MMSFLVSVLLSSLWAQVVLAQARCPSASNCQAGQTIYPIRGKCTAYCRLGRCNVGFTNVSPTATSPCTACRNVAAGCQTGQTIFPIAGRCTAMCRAGKCAAGFQNSLTRMPGEPCVRAACTTVAANCQAGQTFYPTANSCIPACRVGKCLSGYANSATNLACTACTNTAPFCQAGQTVYPTAGNCSAPLCRPAKCIQNYANSLTVQPGSPCQACTNTAPFCQAGQTVYPTAGNCSAPLCRPAKCVQNYANSLTVQPGSQCEACSNQAANCQSGSTVYPIVGQCTGAVCLPGKCTSPYANSNTLKPGSPCTPCSNQAANCQSGSTVYPSVGQCTGAVCLPGKCTSPYANSNTTQPGSPCTLPPDQADTNIRADGRCGALYLAPDGQAARCSPKDPARYVCSAQGVCGNSPPMYGAGSVDYSGGALGCPMEDNIAYSKMDIGSTVADTATDCCAYCQAMTSCQGWSFNKNTKVCWLKSAARPGPTPNANYTSGTRATEWSQWSACTRSCGSGVRQRTCTNILGGTALNCPGPSSQPCNTSPCGQIQMSILFSEYIGDVKAGRVPKLPDFSYAGYHYQEKAIPTKAGPIIDVTAYGCKPNVKYCDNGLKAAIAAVKAASGVLYFPPGTYYLGNPATKWTGSDTMFPIDGSNVVLRGAGPTKTTLYFEADIGILGFNNIEFKGPGRQGPSTSLTKNLKRGDRKIYVASTAGFTVGKCLVIAQSDPKTVKLWYENSSPPTTWSFNYDEGPYVRLLHCISSINATEKSITLVEPIQVNLFMSAANTITVAPYLFVEEVGVEAMTITSAWKYVPGSFSHHASDTDDYGWCPLGFTSARNCWVRDVVFDSVSIAVLLDSSMACTIQNVRVTGKMGHFGINSMRGYGVLVQDVTSDQWHGPSTASSNTNMVALRNTIPIGGRVDSHARHTFNILWDSLTGGVLTGNGGSASNMPHNAKYMTIWNFNHRGATSSARTRNYQFWPPNTSQHAYFQPIIAGLYGDPVTVDQSSTFATESVGAKVLPSSLFEAQLAFRKSGYTMTAAQAAAAPRPASADILAEGMVAGGWTEWTLWSSCAGDCGEMAATRSRQRNCTNPPPQMGGPMCPSSGLEAEKCTAYSCAIAINGNWASWGDWSTCNGPCGSGQWGMASRKRTCTDPAPINGGDYCEGEDTETQPCQTYLCANCMCTDWLRVTGVCNCSTQLLALNRTCSAVQANQMQAVPSAQFVAVAGDGIAVLTDQSNGLDVLFDPPLLRIGERCLSYGGMPNYPLMTKPCNAVDDITQHWQMPDQSNGPVISLFEPDAHICLTTCQGSLCAVPCDGTDSNQTFRLVPRATPPTGAECDVYPSTKTVPCSCASSV